MAQRLAALRFFFLSPAARAQGPPQFTRSEFVFGRKAHLFSSVVRFRKTWTLMAVCPRALSTTRNRLLAGAMSYCGPAMGAFQNPVAKPPPCQEEAEQGSKGDERADLHQAKSRWW